ncbi:hypothetical protein DAEQUDRAFT_134037 [Daedalea quercina L-15889]|uniref:Uncharacterized protein n=1 Tax=Daedalea quercina L-15889 TaxID=1314783 RepID=A0A165KPP9_9APHY|nr:hypothetical protein DAEQUDRAFT_134037 [Daedalea quercina L-15889]
MPRWSLGIINVMPGARCTEDSPRIVPSFRLAGVLMITSHTYSSRCLREMTTALGGTSARALHGPLHPAFLSSLFFQVDDDQYCFPAAALAPLSASVN